MWYQINVHYNKISLTLNQHCWYYTNIKSFVNLKGGFQPFRLRLRSVETVSIEVSPWSILSTAQLLPIFLN